VRTGQLEDLIQRARAGEPRAVARLVSIVEDSSADVRPMMRLLTATGGVPARSARVIGLTGPPGAGKSTTTAALIAEWRAGGQRVGVLAVDPSSPFSGGALLGDRIRMQDHATDPGVFIRSMASRGHLGGIAATTPQAVRVLESAGFDVVLIETVGVGQSEIEVASTADTVVVLLAPGMGDGIQAAKAGILEIGDVYVVNKADRDGADSTTRELRQMLSMGPRRAEDDWTPAILRTVATDGAGVHEFVDVLDRHHDWLSASGELEKRRVRRAAAEVEALVLADLRDRMGSPSAHGDLARVSEEVARGQLDPFSAADLVVSALTGQPGG
jgi:LAO/AO transport system kinase